MNTTEILRTANRKKDTLFEKFEELGKTNDFEDNKIYSANIKTEMKKVLENSKELKREIEFTKECLVEKINSKISGGIKNADRIIIDLNLEECEEIQKEQQKKLDETATIYFEWLMLLLAFLLGGATFTYFTQYFH